jgi:NTP pyrophosphatase (non-canonical NTP hydrolase)
MAENPSLASVMNAIDSFVNERDWDQFHTIKNLVASVSIEASELCETIQWTNPTVNDVVSSPELLQSLSDEIADVMIYCMRLCSLLNLDVLGIIQEKIEINESKYPVDKAKGTSKKYTEFE